jgi:hypothetical protein
MLYQRERVQEYYETRLVRSAVQHWMRRFFLLYVILLPSVSFFCFSPLYYVLFFSSFCWWSLHTNTADTQPEENERDSRLAIFFRFLWIFGFLIFFFFCLCVFPPTRCCSRCHNAADLKHLFCIFVMCVLFFFWSPFWRCVFGCFGNISFYAKIIFVCCAIFKIWKILHLIFYSFYLLLILIFTCFSKFTRKTVSITEISTGQTTKSCPFTSNG